MESKEVIVIGGGQAGLATAYELRKRGVECVVLESNVRIGDQWRRRWDSLRLFTPAWVDGLPGSRFPAADMTFPTKDEVADYLESYANEVGLAVRTGAKVHALRQANDGDYVLETAAGNFTTRNVVIATGYDSPKVPAFAAQLSPGIKQMHAFDYRNPGQLTGDVLVIGAGTSGVEIAIEAAAAGHSTTLAGRATGEIPPAAQAFGGRLFWFLVRNVLTVRTPMGRRMRREGLEHGAPLVRLKMADVLRAGVKRLPRVTGAADGLPLFADGSTSQPGTVVWSTGFRRDYSWVDFDITADGPVPLHRAGVVDDRPGLYFVGLPFQTGLGSALFVGVGKDAAFIAATIAGRLRQSSTVKAVAPALFPRRPEPVATGLHAPAGDAGGREG